MTAECTNDDKWNCKYCRKVKSCEANAVGITDRPPITDSERLEGISRYSFTHRLCGCHFLVELTNEPRVDGRLFVLDQFHFVGFLK